jgi:hypothetical protein
LDRTPLLLRVECVVVAIPDDFRAKIIEAQGRQYR